MIYFFRNRGDRAVWLVSVPVSIRNSNSLDLFKKFWELFYLILLHR